MRWTQILEDPFFRKLSIALAHFLWQGAAVAALLAVADGVARRCRAGAKVRYALACAALAAMALLPAMTFAAAPAAATSQAAASPVAASGTGAPASLEAAHADKTTGMIATLRTVSARASSYRPFLLAAWMAGVIALSLRLAFGCAIVGRLTRRGAVPAAPELVQSLERLATRLAISRPVRLLESASVTVPTVLGMLRPAILLPFSALVGLEARQIEALLAHELAHIRRRDYFVNLLQSAVETLFFYHPAVWWVSSRIRAERENCCDDLAVAVSGDAWLYAGALVELEARRGGRPALALAADGGDLVRRIRRLLPGSPSPEPGHARRAVGGLALSAILVTGVAARFSVVEPSANLAAVLPGLSAGAAEQDPRITAFSAASVVPRIEPSSARRTTSPGTVVAATLARASATPEPTSAGEPTPDAVPEIVPDAVPDPAPPRDRLTDEELDLFRTHGVTAEFLAQIAALGYTRASTDDLISLRIHGVTPDAIGEFQKIFGRISLEQCVELRIHGVTPAWVRDVSAAGLPHVSSDQAVAMRIHGVTPEFLRGFRDAGYDRMSADRAVELAIHGVRPSDAGVWPTLNLGRPSLDELVSARIHGVDPAFAREMQAEGFAGANLEQLTAFRIHGVTPSFVREIKAAGLVSLSADDATSLRIHGVTADFLREMKSSGLAITSADDAESLRIHGVTAAFVREVKGLGYPQLTADEVTSLRIHGVTAEEIRASNRAAGTRLSLDDVIEAHIEGGRFHDPSR